MSSTSVQQHITNTGFNFGIIGIKGFTALALLPVPFSSVNCLYGPSGAGKSTVVSAIKFIRAFTDTGHNTLEYLLLGNYSNDNKKDDRNTKKFPVAARLPATALRNYQWQDHCEYVLTYFQFEYRIVVDLSGEYGSIVSETIVQHPNPDEPGKNPKPVILLQRDKMGKNYLAMGKNEVMQIELDQSAIKDFEQKYQKNRHIDKDDHPIFSLLRVIHEMTIISDLDLHNLRSNGSRRDQAFHIHTRGYNAFTMASLWATRRQDASKTVWVKDTMRAMFPERFADIDFPPDGDIIGAALYPTQESADPESGYSGIHPKMMSDGMLQSLVLLIAVASSKPNATVAVDDIDLRIDPEAMGILLKAIVERAQASGFTLIFTTSSNLVAATIASFPSTPTSSVQVKALRLVDGGTQIVDFKPKSNSNMMDPHAARFPEGKDPSKKGNKKSGRNDPNKVAPPVESETSGTGTETPPDGETTESAA